jgi:hypothetical protein
LVVAGSEGEKEDGARGGVGVDGAGKNGSEVEVDEADGARGEDDEEPKPKTML